VWCSLTVEQRRQLCLAIADVWAELIQLRFYAIGSLCDKQESPYEAQAVGPMSFLPSSNAFTSAPPDPRGCGPFMSMREWLQAIARGDLDYPRDPTKSYPHPDISTRIQSQLDDIKRSDTLLQTVESEPFSAITLEHVDFSPHNIIVNRENPAIIAAIIDWEGARTVPMWSLNPAWQWPGLGESFWSTDETSEAAYLYVLMRARIASHVPAWKSVVGDETVSLRSLLRRARTCRSHFEVSGPSRIFIDHFAR
jgi:hypothetical protein